MASHISMNSPDLPHSTTQAPACQTLTVSLWVVLGWMMIPEVGLAPQASTSCWVSCSCWNLLVPLRLELPLFFGFPLLEVRVVVYCCFDVPRGGERAWFILPKILPVSDYLGDGGIRQWQEVYVWGMYNREYFV